MSPPWTIFQADFLDNGESLVFSTTCTVSADNAERRVYGKLSTISPQKPLLSMCARPPRPPGSYIVNQLLPLEVATPEHKCN